MPDACGSTTSHGDRAADHVLRQAIAELFEARREPLVAHLARRTDGIHTAQDVVAETFAHALASTAKYDPSRGSLSAWVYGIAMHKLQDWRRGNYAAQEAARRFADRHVPVEDAATDRIEETVSQAALHRRLLRNLDALPPATRDAVALRVALDRPYDEVAARLGCTPVAARVRVSRGLALLATAVTADA